MKFLLILISILFFLCVKGLPCQAQGVVVVNAASYAPSRLTGNTPGSGTIAPGSLASAFGYFQLSGNGVGAVTSLPLPTKHLGVTLELGGVACELLFVSAFQINFVVPDSTQPGTAKIKVIDTGIAKTGTVEVQLTSPGLFSANSDGQGPAAAQTTFDGVSYTNLTVDASADPAPIMTLADSRDLYLILYGTGLRKSSAWIATIGGVEAKVTYVGAQCCFVGLDQVNVIIPKNLEGMGILPVTIGDSGSTSNTVTIMIGGTNKTRQVSQVLAANSALSSGFSNGLSVDFNTGTLTLDSTEYFKFNVDSAGSYLATGNLAGSRIEVLDSAFGLIASDCGFGAAGTGTASLPVFLAAGNYLIGVKANGITNARYSLQMSKAAVPALPVNATVNGSLTQGNRFDDGTPYEMYCFDGVAGQTATIEMRSSLINSFLLLRDPSGRIIAIDDDSGGALDALMSLSLTTTGKYFVYATSFSSTNKGGYTLRLRIQ